MADERPLCGGVYRHYKGHTYQVLHIARMEGTKELYVVYEGCFDGRIWMRPLRQWFETVRPNTGDRTPRARFTYEPKKTKAITGGTP